MAGRDTAVVAVVAITPPGAPPLVAPQRVATMSAGVATKPD